jgi:NAD+ synthase
MMTRSSDIADWIRHQVALAGAQGVVIALTGDLGSAVVARLSQMALPGRAIGAIASCHGDARDEQDADSIARDLDLPVVHLDLAPAYDRLFNDLEATLLQLQQDRAADPGTAGEESTPRMPAANLKPRLRMSALFFIAESLNCLVAGGANRGEVTLGAFAKYGDGAVDLLPLGQLLDTEVRALGRELDIPAALVDRPRTPRERGEIDEAQLGFSYADLERYLKNGPDGVSPALAMRIERLLRNSEIKRPVALIPDFES